MLFFFSFPFCPFSFLCVSFAPPFFSPPIVTDFLSLSPHFFCLFVCLKPFSAQRTHTESAHLHQRHTMAVKEEQVMSAASRVPNSFLTAAHSRACPQHHEDPPARRGRRWQDHASLASRRLFFPCTSTLYPICKLSSFTHHTHTQGEDFQESYRPFDTVCTTPSLLLPPRTHALTQQHHRNRAW